ncbi:MAG TPA: glycosyltransferase family 39 protein [Actinocatenispora sp.]
MIAERGPRAVAPWVIGGAVAAVLVALSGRYGYHRDELYFLLCARHLAWGYVDQGPLTPAIAWLAQAVAPDSLVALRFPSALLAGASVVLVGAIARELGARPAAQTFAALVAAMSGAVLVSGHLLTTTTPDVTLWLAAVLCTVRVLRTGDTRWMLGTGLAIGVGMLNKPLPALLGVSLVAGVLIAGPRRLLRDRWVLAAAGIAVLLALPYAIWQAVHGFPQLGVAGQIAGGDSSYSGRGTALLLQFLIISPYAVPVWLAGLVALLRRESWRPYRALAWAFFVALAIVLVAGGKGYYDAPLLLALTAAGAVPTVDWATRVLRRAAVPAGLVAGVVTAATAAVLLLPTLPGDRLPGFVVAANYDSGETVGWPAFADSLATAYRGLPASERARAVILTGNYGEAGAVARYGPDRGLPRAYSGHNSMAGFGVPPANADVVIAVGYDSPVVLRRWFTDVRRAGRIDERVSTDNDENGGPVWVCRGLRRSWPSIWRTEVAHTG